MLEWVLVQMCQLNHSIVGGVPEITRYIKCTEWLTPR